MAKAKPIKKEVEKDIKETIEQIRQRFGEGSIMTLAEGRKVNVDAIATGSVSLDLALGVGGLPRGRIVEIFGPESSGKTTLALHIASQAQKTGGRVAFIDAEHALDPEYSKRIGVKIEDLLISQPDSGEEALNICETLVKSGVIDVVIIDSVAALTPQKELEGEIGEQTIGLQARLMSQALRKLTALVAKSNSIVIFINQIRMQIGIFFGNPETTPGGKALKFFSSVRIEVRRLAQIKRSGEVVGSRIRAKVVKNKVAAPFKTAELNIFFNQGIDYELDTLETGLKAGVIKKSGNSLIFENAKLGSSLEGAREFLKNNQALLKQIVKELKSKQVSI